MFGVFYPSEGKVLLIKSIW